MFNKIAENVLFCNLGPKLAQTGGANSINTNFLWIFLNALGLLLIKILLVQISYNIVVPRILASYNVNMSKYRPLNFIEALFLVILINNLFSRF